MTYLTAFATAKNKLYVILNKRRNLITVLIFLLFFLGPFIVATNNEVLIKVLVIGLVVPLYLACGFLILEDADRKYKKARQLLKDQSDSSSPHWDGQVRYVQDIEPRLQLLKTQILQAQLEIKRIQIAKEQKQS
jgi:hypothetical protein